jgi:hypothetical protein
MANADHRNCVFNWLCLNYNKELEPERWAALLGIKIIDTDGWRGTKGRSFEDPIGLTEFMQRVFQCTIR